MMDQFIKNFALAYKAGSGVDIARTLQPPTQPSILEQLYSFHNAAQGDNIRTLLENSFRNLHTSQLKLDKSEALAWVDVYVSYWEFLDIFFTAQWHSDFRKKLYESWKETTNSLIKAYSANLLESWTLPCLYIAGRWLRSFAIGADQEDNSMRQGKIGLKAMETEDIAVALGKCDALEDAARILNRMFTLCITDRAAMIDSRKWALYYITNLLFKTYFKLNTVSLCKNPWRALQASHIDMPPLDAFPKSHICTFKYYVGLMFFLEEDYHTAESNLNEAYQICHSRAHRNLELILTYLIPCRLMTVRQLPKAKTLEPYPQLQKLFAPASKAIQSGNLASFDEALSAGEDALVRARIYLTLERGRDVCLRNLFRKVFLAGGTDDSRRAGETENVRRTRVPVDEFVTAVQTSMGPQGCKLERDEVECLLANAIHKGHMKGYIARERGMVVLSKGSAFPGTGV